jgi:hypothetical protein
MTHFTQLLGKYRIYGEQDKKPLTKSPPKHDSRFVVYRHMELKYRGTQNLDEHKENFTIFFYK